MPGSCLGVGAGGSKTLAWGFAMAPHRLRALVNIKSVNHSLIQLYKGQSLSQTYPGSEFIVANTLAKSQMILTLAKVFSQKEVHVSTSCSV